MSPMMDRDCWTTIRTVTVAERTVLRSWMVLKIHSFIGRRSANKRRLLRVMETVLTHTVSIQPCITYYYSNENADEMVCL